MTNKTILKSSGLEFNAYKPTKNYYAEHKDILLNKEKYKNKILQQGFLVVRNLMNKEIIKNLRDQYYQLFKEEYKKLSNDWYQIKEPQHSHGYGNHPVKNFIKSNDFLKFVNDPYLKKIVSILLGSYETALSKRVLVRSFSSLSSFTTSAHRDSEYYISSNPSEAITAWIPLGLADKQRGQLVYLDKSHNFKFIDKSNYPKKDKVISKNLSKLAMDKGSKWLIPDIYPGDVIFHGLNIVHASFESKTLFPRLSCDLRFASAVDYLDPRWNEYWYGEDGL